MTPIADEALQVFQTPEQNNCCRQGLTPTDHARLNRQAIKQMSLRNKETKQSNQQQEAHKIRAISRPIVKTPVASRQGLQNAAFVHNISHCNMQGLSVNAAVLLLHQLAMMQSSCVNCCMNSLHGQLLRRGSLLVARELSSSNLLVVCQNTCFTVAKHTISLWQPLFVNNNFFLDMTCMLVCPKRSFDKQIVAHINLTSAKRPCKSPRFMSTKQQSNSGVAPAPCNQSEFLRLTPISHDAIIYCIVALLLSLLSEHLCVGLLLPYACWFVGTFC